VAHNNSDGLNGVRSLLKPYAKQIEKTFQSYKKAVFEINAINNKEKEALIKFEGEHTKYIIFGLFSILALFFDFWISRETMKPIAQIMKQKPEVVALLFNLLDLGMAIFASGILAKDAIRFDRHTKQGGILLWVLCFIKIVLFVVYGKILLSGHISLVGMLVVIALAILVYVILHFSGSGLLFFITKTKYWLMKNWAENPDAIKNNNRKAWNGLRDACKKYSIDFQEALEIFDIKEMELKTETNNEKRKNCNYCIGCFDSCNFGLFYVLNVRINL